MTGVKLCSDEQLTRAINAPTTPCAAPCGVPLSNFNILEGDELHADCGCQYRDTPQQQPCGEPLLDPLWWQRMLCEKHWRQTEAYRERMQELKAKGLIKKLKLAKPRSRISAWAEEPVEDVEEPEEEDDA